MNPRRWLALLLLTPAGTTAAQQVHYEGSLGAATGRYIFSARTTSAGWTNGLALTTGRLTIRGSVPVWWQNTVLLTASGAGPIPSGGGGEQSRAVSDSGAARRRRGSGGPQGPGASQALAAEAAPVPVDVTDQFQTALGDPLASASLRVVDGAKATLIVGVGAKIPVTDTAHFGTGEWDIGGSASLALKPSDRILIGLDVSYWHLGDLAALDFRNPVSGGVSVSRLFGLGWGGILMASAATSALEGFAGPASVGTGLTRFIGKSSWGLNLSIGLSDTAPDFSGGVTWRVGF